MRATLPAAASILLAACTALGAADLALDDGSTHGRWWPNWRGPDCSGGAIDPQAPLVSDPRKAKVVWENDTWLPVSYGKPYSGGFSSPIIAYDRVFLSYWLSDGKVISESDKANVLKDGWIRKNVPKEYQPLWWSITAEDHMLCVDLKTGKTLWHTKVPGAANLVRHTKGGGLQTGCAAYGRYYSQGNLGRVICVDAETGKVLWTNDDPNRPGTLEKMLAAKSTEGGRRRQIMINQNLVFADGVIAAVSADNTLYGIDARTGATLWSATTFTWEGRTRVCSGGRAEHPVRWSWKGKELFISNGVCFEPRTGKVRWMLPNVPLGSPTLKQKDKRNKEIKVGDTLPERNAPACMPIKDDLMLWLGLSCYRISHNKKPELVWTHYNKGRAAASFTSLKRQEPRTAEDHRLLAMAPTTACAPAISDGKVFTPLGSTGKYVNGNSANGYRRFYVLDLETGNILAQSASLDDDNKKNLLARINAPLGSVVTGGGQAMFKDFGSMPYWASWEGGKWIFRTGQEWGRNGPTRGPNNNSPAMWKHLMVVRGKHHLRCLDFSK